MNDFIDKSRENRLQAYRASPGDIREHFGIEQVVLAGGYGYRQALELVQNGADAILEAHEAGACRAGQPRIDVLLDSSYLYVANTGAPFSEEGIDALLRSHSSPKRGNQIGRFGLGFKSLLRLGGKIDITSGQAAFGFDPERCRAELQRQFGVQDAPGLRLAWPLEEDRAGDLRNRFPWATTVVCAEIRAESFYDHLRKEIENFPAEFLLFLPVPVSLTLDTSGDGASKRELHRDTEGEDVVLRDGTAKSSSRWRVVERQVSITDQRAKDDATHVHTRDVVPLAWAMPIEGKREEAGRFWAFFPTHTPTYLPGILNAPWKLNSDRNAVISGEWNTALMKEAANLVADSLPQLRADDDPGRPLDAFPRQLERRDEDAAPLIEALWTRLEGAVVIPDATGRLRQANELWLHPRDKTDLPKQWQALAGEGKRGRMVDPSCLEGQRGSRLKALAERLKPEDATTPTCPNLRKCEARNWFTAVASAETARAIEVLKLAEAYEKDCKSGEWGSIRPMLAIVPCGNGNLLTPGQAVFAPEGAQIPDGRHPVAKELCDNPEARRILTDVLKVKPLDDSVWTDVLSNALPQHQRWESPSDDRWRAFWNLLRSAPERVRHQHVRQNSYRLRVLRRDGEWVLAAEVLSPGALVSADDTSSNQQVLVHTEVHGEDEDLLAELGVCQFPEGTANVNDFDRRNGVGEWLSHWRSHYSNIVNSRATWSYLEPSGLTLPNGWHFLPKLTDGPNSKLTTRFLALLDHGQMPTSVKFGHSTVPSYPKIEVPHPLLWLLLRYGTWNVGGSAIRLAAIVDRASEPAMASITDWENLKANIEKLKGTIPKVPASPNEIRGMWQALIKSLVTPQAMTDDSLRELWAGAARDKVVPVSLPTTKGDVLLAQVFVTGSADLSRRARSQGHVAVTLDADALSLWLEKGARDLAELMQPQWREATGPEGLLVATVPELAEVLRSEVLGSARCQPVAALKLLVAGDGSDVPCLMWKKTLLLEIAQLASLSRNDRLQHLLAEAAAAGWLKHSADEALRILGDARVDELRAHVAEAPTLAQRLLRAVGNREEPLRQALGKVGGMDFLQGVEPLRLAELVLAQLGPATLSSLKVTLEEEGLKPPSRWNTAEARAFVASIGFPDEFAASPQSRREPEEFISGPIELPPLHDFQDEVLDGIRTLINSGTTRRRAVVSLPTGGGKTLVTVEAAVLYVLKPEGAQRSVIWVAQTDELCEQAVQAFRQVWLNLGAKGTDLRIVRLWGGNPNPAIQEPDKPVVMVASIKTHNSRMGGDGLAGLRNPRVVLVDECHHAITPSYTNLLRFLDAEAPRPGTPPKDEPPILGLSATPFRTDDEESGRLARRFDSRWLPPDQEDLHSRLRGQGVLAEVDNEALESGIDLTPEEIERLSKIPEPWEGLDFENLLESINQRLAGSEQRNERLVNRIKEAAEGSILFFSNSVLHGQEMAARLNLEGISAAAISGDTPSTARRYFLSRFQRGEIRVLCNHTVLSTGFDAPKTDMILISRAVFSPVRYMQMVGRGLRGEKNGGKARCRIVTVLDNLGRFQDRHPYHYCRGYFAENTGNT
jgi:superfamily II DNA or RNA helicase